MMDKDGIIAEKRKLDNLNFKADNNNNNKKIPIKVIKPSLPIKI
jgi:hypothetical protein